MDFAERKKTTTFPKADTRNPWMGLNGRICKEPAYWCRMHEVWLSEADVAQKKCQAKPTYNMLATRKCHCLECKTENPFLIKKENPHD